MNSKRIIKLFVVAIAIIMQLLFSISKVDAANIGETKSLERGEKGYYCVQKWDGKKWIYLTYNQTFYTDTDGQKYIAYCLSPGQPGVGYVSGEKETYDVKINKLLDDDVIWRVLKNGYPNKSVSELGVETADDAYFATMQAINAILRGHSIEQAKELYTPGQFAINGENYDDIQRRGTKTLNLMYKLMDIGLNGKETRSNFLNISIKKVNNLVKENEQLYSQTFKVQSSAEIAEFEVLKLEGLPEGSYSTDINNNKKQIFKGNESFKVYIPKEKIVKDFNGKISIKAKQKNYPIYYGEAQIEGFQNYALCNKSYSDAFANIEMNVKTDKSNLKIIKIDSETKEPIEGVKFQVTYADKTVEEYITDKDGCIDIKNQRPGTIIVKEIEAVGKYKLDSKEHVVDLKFDESKELEIVNRLQKGNIKIIKVDKDNNEIKLSGVKFVLKDENKNDIKEGVTNDNGELFFNDLVIGYYSVVEVDTNKEYELIKDELNVEVIDGTTEEMKIENQKIKIPDEPKKIEIPQSPEKEVEKTPEKVEEVVEETKIVKSIKEEAEVRELPKTGEDDLCAISTSICVVLIYNSCLIMVKISKKCL